MAVAPVLLIFPEPVRRITPGVPVTAALVSLALAVALGRRLPVLQWLTAALGAFALAAWLRVAGEVTALSHFTNLSLGLFVLMLVPAVCLDARRLLIAAVLLMALGAGAMTIGLVATDIPPAKFLPLALIQWFPQRALSLPGLDARGLVNRNVLGLLALFVFPFVLVVRAEALRRGRRRVALALLVFAVCAAGIVLVTQSLSAWAASLVVGMVALVAGGGKRRLMAGATIGCLSAGSVAAVLLLDPATAGPPQKWSREWTTRGAELRPVTEPFPGGTAEVRQLVELPKDVEHSISSAQSYGTGFYLLSVHARPAGRSAVWLAGATNGARCNLRDGQTYDFGSGTATAALLGSGWYRCQVVFTTRAVDRSVAVSLLLNYPRGALYETDGSEGVLLTEPILVRAQTPYDYAAMGAVLVRGAARWSLDSRIEIWTQAVARVKGASWTGVGLNHFRHLYKPHRSVDTGLLSEAPHAHNLPLQVTLDLGLPGLLVYTALAVWLFLRSWQAASGPDALARGVGLAAMLGLVAIHAFGVTDAIALGAKVGLLQWFAAGLGVAAFQLQQPA